MRSYPRIEPAQLDPVAPFWAPRFGDHYFQVQNPVAERSALFVEGPDLVSKMGALPSGSCLRIGETGFGCGLTCLVVLDAFLKHAPPNTRLQWISAELHPLLPDDLSRMHHALELSESLHPFAAELRAHWPPPIAGGHRRHLAGGRLVLDLHWGDGAAVFEGLDGRIDAWCLDGFAPNRNPELWQDSLYHAMSRLSVPGATVATFTAATVVREGLQAAGFQVSREPGVFGKRHRLQAQWPGEWHPHQPQRTATVVGAGLAGAFVARGLANRGYTVTVLEADSPAAGASGNPQGITYTKLAIDADPLSRWQWLGLHQLASVYGADHLAPYWHPTGVLLESINPVTELQHAKLWHALHAPSDSLCLVDRIEATSQAGYPVAAGGLILKPAGWLEPSRIVLALLDHPRIECVTSTRVQAIKPLTQGYRWRGERPDGPCQGITDQVILANAHAIPELAPVDIPLKPIRGQVTFLSGSPMLRMALCGRGYLAPAQDNGIATCGATYQNLSTDCTPTDEDDSTNLLELNSLLESSGGDALQIVGHRASVRAATPDYGAVAGLLLDQTRLSTSDRALLRHTRAKRYPSAHHSGWAALGGLGSRGTLTAPGLAELVISALTGEVLPQSRHLVEAVAPERFALKALAQDGN